MPVQYDTLLPCHANYYNLSKRHSITMTSQPFKPAWWLNNGHLQTLFPALFRKSPPLRTRRERLTTPDNDFIDIDYHGEGERPLAILLHGLTGSSASVYIQGLQAALLQQGFRSAALNFRGCGGVPNNTSRCYHSGETGDIDFLYQTLRRRHPKLPMAMVGFSLGGNALLKWLGERGTNAELFAAVAVSVPLLLDKCATRLDTGFSKLYRNRLLCELKAYLGDKQRHLINIDNLAEAEKIIGLGDLASISSFWQYDQQVIARLYGFTGAADYYRRSSSRQYLQAIRVPTLLIQAADDPFMTAEVLPQPAELSDAVHLEITAGGGHVGFIGGASPFKPQYWLDSRISEFLSLHLLKSD